MTTQILFFHDDPRHSRANRALVDAAAALPGVEITDMGTLYASPDDINVDAEVGRLLAADRLVLQFPVQWYSTPPLLKAWQDKVLTRMYYINPDEEGVRLKGLPVMVTATAGNFESAYAADGVNLFPLAELLRPLELTAHRCGWNWTNPFLIYRAAKIDDEELALAGADYAARIARWMSETTNTRKAA